MRAAVALIAALLIAAPVIATGAPDGAGTADRRGASGEGQRCPRGDHEGYEARRLKGKTTKRARKAARRRDCYIRVIKRNGEYLAVTDDFVVNRINVGVRRHVVKSIHGVH
jgi:hypothetical protein